MIRDIMATNCAFPNLRAEECGAIVAEIKAWEAARVGGLIFVAGPRSSGRALLLTEVAARLRGQGGYPLVVGSLASDQHEGDRMSRSAIDISEDAGKVLYVLVQVLGVPPPIAALLDEAVQRSSAALRLLDDFREHGVDIGGSQDIASSLLLNAASDGLVLILDDLDGAGTEWCADLLYVLAPAALSRSPLIVVAGGNGPTECPDCEDASNDYLFVAADIVHSAAPTDRVRWVPLTRRTAAQWREGLTCSEDLAAHLWDTSGGDIEVARYLWQDWSTRKILLTSADGLVEFSPDADIRALPDLFRGVLRRIHGLSDLDIKSRALLIRALQLGALQGEAFTADAVALALDRNRDELVDLIDNNIACDSRRPDGLVHEAPHETAVGADGTPRYLCTYRFAGPGLWLALRNAGLLPSQRVNLATKLSAAIFSLYGQSAGAERVRLLNPIVQGVEKPPERPGRRPTANDPSILLWRAHMHLAVMRSGWSPARYARAARSVIEACKRTTGALPLAESRRLADGAVEFARASGQLSLEGRALIESFRVAALERNQERALGEGKMALKLLEACGEHETAAAFCVGLSVALRGVGDEAGAMRLLEQARLEGTRSTVAHALSEIALAVGLETPRASEHLLTALRLWGDSDEVVHVKQEALRRLAWVELNRGAMRRAQQLALQAVACGGDNVATLPSLYLLSKVHIAAGRFTEAHAAASSAVALSKRSGGDDSLIAQVSLGVAEAFAGYPLTGPETVISGLAGLLAQIQDVRRAGLVGSAYANVPASYQRIMAIRLGLKDIS